MHITAQGPRLQNDLYCVEWDVKLYYTIPSLAEEIKDLHTAANCYIVLYFAVTIQH